MRFPTCPKQLHFRNAATGGGPDIIRIREFTDPDRRARVRDTLARRRDMSPAAVPDWFELDDADFVDLLNDLKEQDDAGEYRYEPRM